MDTWYELVVRARIGQLMAENYAMDAANAVRRQRDAAPAYSEDAFMRVQQAFVQLETEIREHG